MNDISETLKERGDRYGDFDGNASISQALKKAMQCTKGWANLNAAQSESLEMIAHKIARILNGDPNYVDYWQDIAGYAKLVEDLIERNGSGALKEGKGWIEWTGGDCPVSGSSVDIKYRDGEILKNRRYYNFRWSHEGEASDIISYRICEDSKVDKNDGWIKWDGGECPVDGQEIVEVRFTNGEITKCKGKYLTWVHGYGDDDIVAYRFAD